MKRNRGKGSTKMEIHQLNQLCEGKRREEKMDGDSY